MQANISYDEVYVQFSIKLSARSINTRLSFYTAYPHISFFQAVLSPFGWSTDFSPLYLFVSIFTFSHHRNLKDCNIIYILGGT